MADSPASLLSVARAAFERNEVPEALMFLRQVLQQDARNVPAIELLYRIERSQDRQEDAARSLARIIAIDPTADWAYNDLVRLLFDGGRPADAERLARTALRVNPRNAIAHSLFGTLLSGKNELPAGEWHFRRAAALAPDDAGILANLALNLMQQGRVDDAERCYADADRLAPGSLAILSHWSKLAEVRGELPRAAALLDRAAAAASETQVNLLRSRLESRAGRQREALAILEACRDMNGDGFLERGRLRDALGWYDAAWEDFVTGKRKLAAQAGNVVYQGEAVHTFFSRLESFFTRDNLERLPSAPLRRDLPQPIFVVGFPRSGTTLVEQILASHSAVRAGGELPFAGRFREIVNRLYPDDGPFPENLSRTWTADGHFVAWLLRDLYFALAEQANHVPGDHRYFVDKMPFNEVYLPLIRMAFPDSPIVRVARHPLDVCVSMMAHHFTHGFNCGYRIEDVVTHLSAVHGLLEQYRRSGMEVFTMRYEDLVSDQEATTRRLLEHAGLAFEAACLRFDETRRYAPTPSYAEVTDKLNDRSVGRHRHYARHLDRYVPQLRPMIEAMKY